MTEPSARNDDNAEPGPLKRLWRYLAEQDEAGAARKARRSANKGAALDRQAAKQEQRALKMSKKIGRGGRRSAKAAQTAVGLRAAAERERSGREAQRRLDAALEVSADDRGQR